MTTDDTKLTGDQVPVHSDDLLNLAALGIAWIDRMAHALGWPSVEAVRVGRAGRVKWVNPYRNGYAAAASDPLWEDLEQMGLAKRSRGPTEVNPYTYWSVTELGKRVVRLRLEAVRLAAQLNATD